MMKEFPPFRLDTVNECLWRGRDRGDQQRIVLTPRAYALLRYLVEHPGRLVTHNELLDALWPNTHVQPEVLKSHIFEVRNALGDDSKKPLFIETLPRRGYRFIAAVSEGASSGPVLSTASAAGRLVGRERPLAALREALQRALKGERQIVFVTGEPGIGKTTLVDEFLRQAAIDVPHLRIGRGQCIEGYGSKEAYYPMLEALGQLCGGSTGESVVKTLTEQAPTWLVQFPALLTHVHRELLQREILGATRERMLREIGEALRTLARSPLLLVFEDLQWVDHSTVDLVSALARHWEPAKLMLVATCRPADLVISDHPLRVVSQDLRVHHLSREIALPPLNEAEVAEYLLTEAPGAPLPDGLAGLVYRHSEGNPLFMVAALEHMTERSLLSRENEGWQLRVPLTQIALAVPETLRQMIEAQIDQLSEVERRVLEAASLSPNLSFSVIAKAAALEVEPESFEDVCERLSRRHNIVRPAVPRTFPDGTISPYYEFTHALYREVFYAQISPGRRPMLHRRVAEWGETRFAGVLSETAPWLAHHFEHGLDLGRAVKYLQMVADNAARRYANREATTVLQHALELSSRLPAKNRALRETEILEQLAAIYVVSLDARAVETYEMLVTRAASHSLIDVEARGLVGLSLPLAWSSAERCLGVVDRALRLSARQSDPLLQARTRASCLFWRVWVGGWNPRDVEAYQSALAEIREVGDRRVLALHLIDAVYLQCASSAYRAAYQSAAESIAILFEGSDKTPDIGATYYKSELIMPWSLLFLGEWGEALRELEVRITRAEKNGNDRDAQRLRVFRAWVHLQALDFANALSICESALPGVKDAVLTPALRICMILAGTAETALEHYARAREHLAAAKDAMNRQMIICDWYWHMALESALTDLWLAQGDLGQARAAAARFLEVTRATAERTWQALAWDANARVAMAEGDLERAQECIDEALSTIDGFEVPLAAWRVHGTAADLHERTANRELAGHHRVLSRATILKLADSLGPAEPLRQTFLSAPSVRHILGDG